MARHKPNPEFEKFNRTMDAILRVPYSVVKDELEAEKKIRAQKRKRKARRSAASRVSSEGS